jgi:hypothetical protein
MVNVFMDDLRPCPKGFVLTRSVEQCKKLLNAKRIEILSLDHDMGFGEPTGFDLAKYMVKHNKYAKQIIIHSANPFGRYRMFKLLQNHKPSHVKITIRPEPLYLL